MYKKVCCTCEIVVLLINFQTYKQIHTPTVVQGMGWMEPPPRSF